MAFGEWIWRERKRLGLTQRQLARRLGATDGYISHLEKELRVPSREFAIALARVFELSPEDRDDFLGSVDQARLARARRRSQQRGRAVSATLRPPDDAPRKPALRLLDLLSGEVRLSQSPDTVPRCLALGPRGLIAGGTEVGTIFIWQGPPGRPQPILTAHEGPVSAIALSPDGSTLVSGGADGAMRLWHTGPARERCTVSGESAVTALAFSVDGRLIAAGRADGTVKVWAVDSGATLRTIATQGGAVRALAFSPESAVLASGNGGVALWNLSDGRLMRALRGLRQNVQALVFSPDGSSLAASGPMHEVVQSWEVAADGDPIELTLARFGVLALGFLSDTGTLITVSPEGWVDLWESGSGRPERSLKLGLEPVMAAALSADGTTLVTAGEFQAEPGRATDSQGLAAKLESDPELREVYRDLLTAYSHPDYREAVMKTLRGLARAAESD